MTVQEIVEAALARAMEFSDKVPNTFSVSVGRMNQRHQQLFARIAERNRDYAGRDAELTLTAGACDTADLDPLPMRISLVTIDDPGSSSWPVGRPVKVVPVDDLDCALPPRMTLRDGILQQVGTDLQGVTSVRVWYAKRPADLESGADVPAMPAQYHELLVIDLAKSMIRKTIALNATSRKEILDVFTVEEEEVLADFDAHLRNFQYAEVSRFGRTTRQD
jgi:hypothetical protein